MRSRRETPPIGKQGDIPGANAVTPGGERVAELVQNDAGEQGRMNAIPESAAALPPASQYVIRPSDEQENVACT